MDDLSLSYKLREKGNKILLSIQEQMAPIVKESRLNEAYKIYLEANDKANNNLERSSACKNLSTALYKLFKLDAAKDVPRKHMCHYYMTNFLEYMRQALTFAKDGQSLEWSRNLCYTSTSALNDYQGFIKKHYNYADRISYLYKLLAPSCDHAKCIINYFICKFLLEYSIQLTESKNIKEASIYLKDFNFHYEECKRTLKYFECDYYTLELNLTTIKGLYQDVIIQTCVVEGLQSKLIGQDLLKKCINDTEVLNIDLLYDVIDWYRDSIIKTHDKDIECEAEVSSDLGYIYDEILKLTQRGKQYYQNSWHLAESLKPKIFTRYKWFMRCSLAIQRYQREISDAENKELDSEREKVLADIKDDLDKINKKSTNGVFDFLEFIYKDYSPKNSKHVLIKDLDSTNIKKAVRDAIVHYHPDKNSIKEHGSKWFFITEEITKNLNTFYATLKSQ